MVQIKVADIIELANEMDKIEKLYLDKENDKFITYYPKFSDDKINELFQDLNNTIIHCKEIDSKLLENDAQEAEYLQFLIVKHFTSLKDELDDKSVDVHFETKKALEKSGLQRLLLDHVFDSNEIHKILDRRNDLIKLIENIVYELERNPQNKDKDKLQVVDKLVN